MPAKKFPASRSLVCRGPEKIIKKTAFLPSFYRKIIVFCKLKIVFFNAPHFERRREGDKINVKPLRKNISEGLNIVKEAEKFLLFN